jgi:hypothetical protein
VAIECCRNRWSQTRQSTSIHPFRGLKHFWGLSWWGNQLKLRKARDRRPLFQRWSSAKSL